LATVGLFDGSAALPSHDCESSAVLSSPPQADNAAASVAAHSALPNRDPPIVA